MFRYSCLLIVNLILLLCYGGFAKAQNMSEPERITCSTFSRVNDPVFVGTIFYQSQVNDAPRDYAIWRLTPDLRTENVLPQVHRASYAFMNFPHDRLALMDYGLWTPFPNDPIWSNPSLITPPDERIWIADSQGNLTQEIIYDRDSWSSFNGWTQNDRLVISHKSIEPSQNGVLLISPDGEYKTFFDFPDAFTLSLPNSRVWDSVNFYVSPTEEYIIYDSEFEVSGKGMRRGFNLAGITGQPQIWQSDTTLLDGMAMWPGIYSQPTWSPSGRYFAYSHNANDLNEIEIAIVDLNGRERIVTNINDDTWYIPWIKSWSPDERWILFSYGPWDKFLPENTSLDQHGGVRDFYLLDVTTNEVHSLCRSYRYQDTILWSPDSTSLMFLGSDSLIMLNLENNTLARIPIYGELPQLLGWFAE
jgi:sugar lactone lactonase YvrE